MRQLVKVMHTRNKEGKGSVLVTVTADRGSSPRSAGASMVVGENGLISGTIGGGMLEFEAIKAALRYLEQGSGGLVQYRLTAKESAGLGMACGGNVDVLFTYVNTDESTGKILEEILHCLNRHEDGWLVLGMDGKEIACRGTDGISGREWSKAGIVFSDGHDCYVQKLTDKSRVYIFGGGHLAQELVPLLSHLDFRCVVTDDREEFASKELFPEAEEIHVLEYDKLEGRFDIQPQDYVVIVTRGHIGDYEVEKYALGTPAYYIGAIGSRQKVKLLNEKLMQDGFGEKEIARVTSPVGIEIGSETPAEIAVSIAAQLIERRSVYK